MNENLMRGRGKNTSGRRGAFRDIREEGDARVWGGDTGVLAHVGPAASPCLLSVGGVYRVVLKAKRPFCAALFFALM